MNEHTPDIEILEAAKRELAQSPYDLDAVRRIETDIQTADQVDPSVAAERSYLLGLCAMLRFQGNIESVLDHLQLATRYVPDKSEYVATLVETLLVANRHEDARQTLYRAEDPSDERIRELHAKVDSAMQAEAMTTDAGGRLLLVADEALTQVTSIVVTPWLTAIFPWSFLAPQPIRRTLLFCTVLLLPVLLMSYQELSFDLFVKYMTGLAGVFVGLLGPFFFARRFEEIYRALNRIVNLRSDRLAIWFKVNISPLFGYVNHPDAEALGKYGLRELWKYDRVILVWFILAVTIGSLVVAPAYTRTIPPQFTPTGVAKFLGGAMWEFSMLWALHFIPYSVVFLRRLSRLDFHYYYGMPNELSLKSVGRILVHFSSYTFLSFFTLMLICYAWGSMSPEPNVSWAINAFSLIVVLAMNLLMLVLVVGLVIAAQVGLTLAILRYKAKRKAEYAVYTEKAFNEFRHNPCDETYKRLEDRVKQGRRVFSRLPVLSLTGFELVALIVFVCLNGAFLYWVVASSDGAIEFYEEIYAQITKWTLRR